MDFRGENKLCEKYLDILCEILLVLHNNVMDLNSVMGVKTL